jgi:MbeD/MobD like.
MKKYAVMLCAVSAIAFSPLSFAGEDEQVMVSSTESSGSNSGKIAVFRNFNYVSPSSISLDDLRQVSENKKQIDDQKSQISDLSRKISGYEQTISQLQRSNDELKRSLDSRISENNSLSQKVDNLSRKIDDLSQKIK